MTKCTLADKSMQMNIHQYVVTGRHLPTEADPEPKVFRMKIFARNEVVAKSRFWYFMKRLQRIKKANGEILDVAIVQPRKCNKARNFGIWLRYDSRTGTHNMYKEYRDITIDGAVSQMYQEMAGRHRAASCSIQVIKYKVLAPTECRRLHMTQLQDDKVRFPIISPRPMVPKSLKKKFAPSRVRTFKH